MGYMFDGHDPFLTFLVLVVFYGLVVFLAAYRCGPEEYGSKLNGWIDTILKSVILFDMSFVSFSAMEEVSRDRCVSTLSSIIPLKLEE